MKLRTVLLALVSSAFLVLGAPAESATFTLASGVSGDGTTGVKNVAGPNRFRIMVCGDTETSGSITVRQGPLSTKLTVTKEIALTDYATCSEYYSFDPSAFVEVEWEDIDGTISVYLEHVP